MANTIHCPGVFPSLPEDPCSYLTPARHMRRLAQQKKLSAVRAGMGLYPRFPKVCRGKEILQTSQKKQKEREVTGSDFSKMLALPIFPASHPASIVGACELNFCVRNGNRWTLTAINTNFSRKGSFPLPSMSKHPCFNRSLIIALSLSSVKCYLFLPW